MKLSWHTSEDSTRVEIRGEVDGTECNCLQSFWATHVAEGLREIHIDMSAVLEIDPVGVATMVDLIRDHLRDGTRVVLDSPPQMLAHTLYKIGTMIGEPLLTLENPREEEPYAG